MKRILLMIIFLVIIFAILPDKAIAATDLYPIVLSPYSGSASSNQPVTLKVRYGHTTGTNQIKEYLIWIDNMSPMSRRLYSSIHAKVVKDISGYKFYGSRYNGGVQICGTDTEPRHCYLNYIWDIGGITVGVNSGYIYANHDENLSDTTSPTANTIGQIRAKSINTVSANIIEIEWEVIFGPFFRDKLLEIYSGLVDLNNNALGTNNRPWWHQIGIWRVDSPPATESFWESFETQDQLNGWTQIGPGTSASTNAFSYLGKSSAQISGGRAIEKNLGSDRGGVATVYFWDDMTQSNAFYVALSNADSTRWNQATTQTLIIGVVPEVSTQFYVYKARLEHTSSGQNISDASTERWFETPIARTLGWHRAQFWVTETGAWAELDDPAREIPSYNLSSLLPYPLESNTKFRYPINWEMTSFRYIRTGTLNANSNVWIDAVHAATLPPIPVTTDSIAIHPGGMRWSDYFSSVYLDSYEEVVRYGTMEARTAEHCVLYLGTPCDSWWWGNLMSILWAMSYRYQTTGLPYYRDKVRYIWDFMLDNATTGHRWISGNPHANTVGSKYLMTITWAWYILTPSQRAETVSQLMKFMDSNLTDRSQVQTQSIHIGDSVGEDFVYGQIGGPVRTAIFFNDHPYADRWMDFAREMAMKSMSFNPNEPCETCPGGKVSIKSIYAPGENPQDCSNDPDPSRSQTCLCKGDRGLLPTERDFSYLFDNHAYSPHPAYWRGVIGSQLLGAYSVQLYNTTFGASLPVYPEFSHNALAAWSRLKEFYDFQKIRYRGDKIYRIREKVFCDGDNSFPYWVDRGPFNQFAENTFRTEGADDWHILPNIGVSVTLVLKDILGQAEITVQGYNLLDRAIKSNFWQHYNYLGIPTAPHLQFTASDVTCTYVAPHCTWPAGLNNKVYVQDRINPLHTQAVSSTNINPSYSYPLKVCEENIFQKKVWGGNDLSWDCPTNIKKVGVESLKLSSATNTDAELYSMLKSVKPNTNYKISYWVKTENLVADGATIVGRIVPAQYKATAYESTGVGDERIDSGFTYGSDATGIQDWNQKSYTFRTLDDAKYVRLRAFLGGGGRARGTVYFDNVIMEEIASIPGDFNNDGRVNLYDLTYLLNNWNQFTQGIFEYNKIVTNYGTQ